MSGPASLYQGPEFTVDLARVVYTWWSRGPGYERLYVVLDLTSGTANSAERLSIDGEEGTAFLRALALWHEVRR